MKIQSAIILTILLASLTSALQFSPTKLEFTLEKNQNACENIYFVLDAPAALSDTWAENENTQWSITQFKTFAATHGLSLNYQSHVPEEATQTELCLSGTTQGNYRGALIFRQSEQGNSIVQFAVWLEVSIRGEAVQDNTRNQSQNQQQDQQNNRNSDSRSGSSRSGSFVLNTIQQHKKTEPNENYFQDLDFNFAEDKIKLNPQNLKKQTQKSSPLFVYSAIFATLTIIFLIFLTLNKIR